MTAPSRIYAIGDIHGCLEQLTALLGLIAGDVRENPTPAPVIVTLGDYIDRGPDSPGVLELLSKGSYEGIPIVSLIGNHDWMLWIFLNNEQIPQDAPPETFINKHNRPIPREDLYIEFDFYNNGGGKTLEAYGLKVEANNGRGDARYYFVASLDEYRKKALELIPAHHLAFINGLRYNYQTDNHFFVHAGIDWDLGPETHPLLSIWIRDGFLNKASSRHQLVVHGHTPGDPTPITDGRVNLDSKCYKTGILTCGVFDPAIREPLRFLKTPAAPQKKNAA